MFWECHDPTKNRQGNDIGTQYITIYYKNENNKKIILASKEQYQKELNKKSLGFIETEIKKINYYFFAEPYHQQYLASMAAGSIAASPTKVKDQFYWKQLQIKRLCMGCFNWEIDKCIETDNKPINE